MSAVSGKYDRTQDVSGKVAGIILAVAGVSVAAALVLGSVQNAANAPVSSAPVPSAKDTYFSTAVDSFGMTPQQASDFGGYVCDIARAQGAANVSGAMSRSAANMGAAGTELESASVALANLALPVFCPEVLAQ